MGKQTFRYLACGGSNTVLDTLLFYISFHYILHQQDVHWLGMAIKPYNAALGMAFCISFPLGFILSKYIVFPESNLHGRIQFFRYVLLVATCIVLNYIFLNLFVMLFHNKLHTLAKLLTTGVVAIFSYFSQRKFTFKTKAIAVPEVVPENIP